MQRSRVELGETGLRRQSKRGPEAYPAGTDAVDITVGDLEMQAERHTHPSVPEKARGRRHHDLACAKRQPFAAADIRPQLAGLLQLRHPDPTLAVRKGVPKVPRHRRRQLRQGLEIDLTRRRVGTTGAQRGQAAVRRRSFAVPET